MSSVAQTKSRTVLRAGDVDQAPGSAYLLVVENDSSSIVHLPHTGALVIGSAPAAEVRVSHASVSRRHATIRIDDGVLRIADLGSRNGTRVNGEPVVGSRTLASGDVASVGDVVLVVHVSKPAEISRALYREIGWRRRLVEELERALTYKRSLAVVAVLAADRAAFTVLARHVRMIDVVGHADDGGALLLLPEVDRDGARAIVKVALAAANAIAPTRAGLAVCPTDAVDAGAILSAARAAARRAEPGTVADAASDTMLPELETRPIGEELEELERRRISEALATADFVKTRAAQLIDMPIRTFTLKLKQYGL